MNDHELAGYLAEYAGIELLKLREVAHQERANSWQLRDQGDLISHNLIKEEL